MRGWDTIRSSAKAGALLPNLTSLTISQNGYKGSGFIELLELLISPSLSTLTLNSVSWDRGFLRKLVGLVKNTLSTCTNLRSLSIIRGPRDLGNDIGLSSSELVVPRFLETLELHATELRPQFLGWMASMPRLRELHITDPFELFVEPDYFPSRSFTALRSLKATPYTIEYAVQLWSTPMVNHLTSAKITLCVDSFDSLHTYGFFALLAANSPRLTSLSLVFLESRDNLFPINLLSVLSPLCLDSLEIHGAQLSGVDVFAQIAQLWPSLSTLDVRDTVVDIGDVVRIATLFSKLRNLSLKFAPDLLERAIGLPPKRPAPSLTLHSTFGFIFHLSAEKWDQFAR